MNMPEIKLFIASSLDGYIARPNGSIDWLNEIPNPDNSDFGYTDFYAGIDTVVMGRSTYDEVMGFDVDWPYPDCRCYVVSTNKDYQTSTPNTSVVYQVDQSFIEELHSTSNSNIWLVGGGKLIQSFMNLDVVDELIITFISRIIGDGLPLFPSPTLDSRWEILKAEVLNEAAVILTYRRKR